MRRLALPITLLLAGCATGAPQKAPSSAGTGVAPGAASGPGLQESPPQKEIEPAVAARMTPDAAYRQQAPAAGAEPAFRPPPWKRFKLKNGLDVFLVEFHDLPPVLTMRLKSTSGRS